MPELKVCGYLRDCSLIIENCYVIGTFFPKEKGYYFVISLNAETSVCTNEINWLDRNTSFAGVLRIVEQDAHERFLTTTINRVMEGVPTFLILTFSEIHLLG